MMTNAFKFVTIVIAIHSTNAFQSFFFKPFSTLPTFNSDINLRRIQTEDQLLEAISQINQRLDTSNSKSITSLIEELETNAFSSRWSIPEPAISPQVFGRWRLLYTNNADTASPIQRKAVDASKYNIYQDITLRSQDQVVVSQVVKFGDSFQLVVDALASTSMYPMEELTERERDGKVLGFNILGVSKIGEEAKEDPTRPNSRIQFVFDEGNFEWIRTNADGSAVSTWKIPYPVPFRSPLFRDAVKGWIDITYLSDRIRISRGNKGTTFVLMREIGTDE
jgi:hypothetical protein